MSDEQFKESGKWKWRRWVWGPIRRSSPWDHRGQDGPWSELCNPPLCAERKQKERSLVGDNGCPWQMFVVKVFVSDRRVSPASMDGSHFITKSKEFPETFLLIYVPWIDPYSVNDCFVFCKMPTVFFFLSTLYLHHSMLLTQISALKDCKWLD